MCCSKNTDFWSCCNANSLYELYGLNLPKFTPAVGVFFATTFELEYCDV